MASTRPQTPKRARIAVLVVLWVALAAAATSCTFVDSTSSSQDTRRRMLEELADGVIMPMHRDFEASAAALDAAAQALCAAPDAGKLQATQEAWHTARRDWRRMEVIAFGPYLEEPLRFQPKIDFWPAREDTILEVLEGDSALTVEAVASFGAPARGLPVIEYLLFISGDATPDAALARFEDADLGARRCAYLTALSGDVANNATALREAWDPEAGDFVGEITRAGQDSATFDTLEMAVSEVVSRMGYVCENMRRDRLNPPLGADSGGAPQPELVESRFSDRSIQDIRDGLFGVKALYTGVYGDNDVLGFGDYAERRGQPLDATFNAQYDALLATLDAIEAPLREAVVDTPATVEAALEPSRALQRTIQTDLTAVLGASTTFNDTDGD